MSADRTLPLDLLPATARWLLHRHGDDEAYTFVYAEDHLMTRCRSGAGETPRAAVLAALGAPWS